MKKGRLQKRIGTQGDNLAHTHVAPSPAILDSLATSPLAAQLAAYSAIANSARAHTPAHHGSGGLPQNLQAGIESLSGIAMHDVRVHYNSSKPAQLRAHAYAQGTDIHLAPGQEKHLAHEAWHVVQQKQDRVKPTLQLKGVAINDDSALEREADVMGEKAMGGASLGARMQAPLINVPAAQQPAQRRIVDEKDGPLYVQYFKTNFANVFDSQAKLDKLFDYLSSPHTYSAKAVLNAIANGQEAEPIKIAVNDIENYEKGCSVCVAADFLGTTVSQLLKRIQGKDQKLYAMVMEMYKSDGKADQVLALLDALGIEIAFQESFDSPEDLIASLTANADADAWQGTLIWEGHMVRISGEGNTYRIWDPQTGKDNIAPPKNTKLILVTFA